jgi:transcription elongation factor GreB
VPSGLFAGGECVSEPFVSRAFKRESDESGAEEIPAVRPPLPPDTRNYITREGEIRFRHRLQELLEAKRALAAGNEAEQRRLDAVIRRLQTTLESVVVAETPADQSRVAFGASVTIKDQGGEEDEYQIVGVDEADPAGGQISWICPLARALLSKRAGDKVEFRSPAGVQELTILKVRYA